MVIKTITITEDAYNKIKRLKQDNESFSELFTRISYEKRKPISSLLGVLKTTDKEMEKRRERFKKIREETSRALEERMARLKRR